MTSNDPSIQSLSNSGVVVADGNNTECIQRGNKSSICKNSSFPMPRQRRRNPTTTTTSMTTEHNFYSAQEKNNDIDLYDENDSANFSEEVAGLERLSNASHHQRKDRLRQRRCQGNEREGPKGSESLLILLRNFLEKFDSEMMERNSSKNHDCKADNGRIFAGEFEDSSGTITISFQPNYNSAPSARLSYRNNPGEMKFSYTFQESQLQNFIEGMKTLSINDNALNRHSANPSIHSSTYRRCNSANSTQSIVSNGSITRQQRRQSSNTIRSSFNRRKSRASSISGSFNNIDGNDLIKTLLDDEDEQENEDHQLLQVSNHSSPTKKQSRAPTPIQEQEHEREYHSNDPGTQIHITAEEGWFFDDKAVMQAREFDERVLSKITTVEESHQLLRRMRAVSSLASRLMAAPDETSCYDIVSRLLVPLFEVDRCSYVLLKDPENVIIKQITANKRDHVSKMGMDGGIDGVVKPLNGTAAGVCARTLEQHYTPRTKDSPFETQRMVYTMGLNSVLATPILVNGNKFVGCIIICMEKEDAFREVDRILINDIAAMLGANIYCKRMRQSSDRSNKVAREMLHSMIPAKVIEKIECFWDVKSEEYWRRRSSVGSMTSQTYFESNSSSLHSSYIERADEMNSKINFLNEMNRTNHDYDDGIIIDHGYELTTTSRALYAEEVNNVCIIFLDIVGFSRMSLELKPIQIMDMLHDLFGRYDNLCDKHGVLKLETVGDAYVCATNLLKESDDHSPGDEYLLAKDAALNALEMAKDMVRQAQHVIIPRSTPVESVQVRVGIHIGEVTCGVLGERLPKFAVFGSAVNLAARMEQTSLPGRIRVSNDFYEMVKDSETEWEGDKKCITVKNMGEIDTFLLNPMKREKELTGFLTSMLTDGQSGKERNF